MTSNIIALVPARLATVVGENSLRKLFTSVGFRIGAARVRHEEVKILRRAFETSCNVNDLLHSDHHESRAQLILHGSSTQVFDLFKQWGREFSNHVIART